MPAQQDRCAQTCLDRVQPLPDTQAIGGRPRGCSENNLDQDAGVTQEEGRAVDSPARWVPPRDIPGGWRAHIVNGTVGFTPGEELVPSLQTPTPPRTPVLGPPKPSWPRCSHGPQPRPPQASFLDRRVNEVERARSVTKDEAFTSFWLHTGQPGSPSFSELRWKSLCFGVKSAPPPASGDGDK